MRRSGASLVVLCLYGIMYYVQARQSFKSGKVMIAALLPITNGQSCDILEPRSIQLAETFIYEIRKFIPKFEAQTNVTFGYDIKDTCSSSKMAIKEALGLASGKAANSTCSKDCHQNNIVAVVGPELLENIVITAGILSFHHIPQVIFTGKTRLHSTTDVYRSLMSVVPSISNSVSALTMLIAYFGWKTVNVLGFNDMYAREMTPLLTQNLRAKNICISTEKLFETMDTQIPEVIASLRSRPQVSVTVLVARPDMAAKVLDEARRQNLTGHVWIGSESWTADQVICAKYNDVLEGMLGITYSGSKDKELVRYIEQETRGLSYADWLKRLYGTNVTSGFNKHVIQSRELQLDKTVVMQRAVQGITRVLEHIVRNTTSQGNKLDLDEVRAGMNQALPEHMRRQNGRHKFEILNYQRLPSGEFKFVTVGSWRKIQSNKDEISVEQHAIRWPGTNNYLVPFSGSVRPCRPGTYVKKEPMRCGWRCDRCPVGTYSKNHSSPICGRCPVGQIPDKLQTKCLVAEEEFVRPFDVYGIIILSASVLGFTVTGTVLGIFVKYQNTPVIKASNIGFCLFTLVLLLVWFLSSMLFLDRPKGWICKLRTVVVPLLYTSVSALLLAKTKRLIRIFSALKRNRFLSNYWYSFVVCSIVLVQIIFSTVYLVFFTPERVVVYEKDLTASTHCSRNLGLEVASFSYNCLLAFLCALFAVKSRKLPETYSEAKHICLAMLAYLVSWMVYFFGYYGIPQGKLKAAVPSFGVILGAYAVLCFIFVPKIRVILCLPERNTKSAAQAATRKYSVDVAFGIQMSMYPRGCERRHTLAALPAYNQTAIAASSLSNPNGNCNTLGSRFSPESLGEPIKEDDEDHPHVSRKYSLDDVTGVNSNSIALRNLRMLTLNGLV